MCGIVGLIGENPALASTIVGAMAKRIHHRGPDGGGVAVHGDAVIGMRRLAIVDLAHGQQPMSSDDEQVTLVYNGEIYNAASLRAELEAEGVAFRTKSDTEVILRLYERAPDEVEERLRGMWAFCIHDRRRRRVVLSRDRFGIKPLFIATANRRLAFASELTAFDRAYGPLASCFAIDHEAAHAMLAWSYVPETASIFRGVRRLAPGRRLELDLATGKSHERTYWVLQPSAEAGHVSTLDEACEAVDHALRRAVHEHLASDVPVATFLSGGIDSSLVTAYASERTSLRAYTIGFREPRFDESPHARATAERLGVPLDVTMLDEGALRGQLADALLAYDEPFGDSSSLATYVLCRNVAREYKVALGGDGGDEVFAGYAKYRMIGARRWIARIPGARPVLERALSLLPSRTDRRSRLSNLLRVASKSRRGLVESDAQAYLSLTQVGTLAQTMPLLREPSSSTRFVDEAIARFEGAYGSVLQRTAASDLGSPLPNDMLTKVDRASMAASLEARVPFLDHRVVELGLGLPEAFTLEGRGKTVLRALHARKFGDALANRKKWGFGVPVEQWLGASLAPAASRLFARERLERFGILSAAELSSAEARQAWLSRDPMLLWHAFALAAWCEATLGDGPDALREVLDERAPHPKKAASPARDVSSAPSPVEQNTPG